MSSLDGRICASSSATVLMREVRKSASCGRGQWEREGRETTRILGSRLRCDQLIQREHVTQETDALSFAHQGIELGSRDVSRKLQTLPSLRRGFFREVSLG